MDEELINTVLYFPFERHEGVQFKCFLFKIRHVVRETLIQIVTPEVVGHRT